VHELLILDFVVKVELGTRGIVAGFVGQRPVRVDN
jgi:hypothetical protein